MLSNHMRRLKGHVRSFASSDKGTTAVLIGLTFPVLVALVGAGVDTGYAVAARSELSHITKIACDRLATSAARGEPANRQVELTTQAIAANMSGTLLKPGQTHFDFAAATGADVAVRSIAAVDTYFMGLVGVRRIGVAAEETCSQELRVPTIDPEVSCDASVPVQTDSGGFSIDLATAISRWQQHNATSALPPAPDEMIVTALDSHGNVLERDLLTNVATRGGDSVRYRNLPTSRITLQPLNGFPLVLPDACVATTNPPLPPVVPPTTPTTATTPTTTNPPPQNDPYNCTGGSGGNGNSSSSAASSNSSTSNSAQGTSTTSNSWANFFGNNAGFGGSATSIGGSNSPATVTATGGSNVSNGNSSASSNITASATGCMVSTSYSSSTSIGGGGSSGGGASGGWASGGWAPSLGISFMLP